MIIKNEKYSSLLDDIKYRKGKYFIEAVENFCDALLSSESEKIVSTQDKYELYRLEANIRWNFYRYLENIERIITAALATKNEYLNQNEITNKHKFKLWMKLALVSGTEDSFKIKTSNNSKKKQRKKL